MVQAVTAVRLTRSYTEGHANAAGKVDVGKDVVAEETAAGTRTGTTARRTVTTATVASTRAGTHTEAAALEARKGVRGRGRGNQASGRGRGRGQDTGQNQRGRCGYCHNSTEHGWVAQLPPPPLA